MTNRRTPLTVKAAVALGERDAKARRALDATVVETSSVRIGYAYVAGYRARRLDQAKATTGC